MKFLMLTPNGQIPPKIIANFGGEFSFWEKIKMKGVGSPKMILEATNANLNQLELFDDLLIYANLELLRQGFVLRVWQHKGFRAVVFGQDEIEKMIFNTYKIRANKPNIFAGDFTFYAKSQELKLFIPPNSFKKMTQFVQKKHFQNLIVEQKEDKNPDELLLTGINIINFLQN